MKLKNYQEDLVLHIAEIVLQDRPDVEFSQELLLDVAAYTLNRVPSRYIVGERGITRLVADHWTEDDADDGFKGLVEILLIINTAIDLIRDRRKSEKETESNLSKSAGQSEEDKMSFLYWHNIPFIIGRVADKTTGKPVSGAEVTLCLDGRPAILMERSWQNPYRTSQSTRGFYSFLPAAIRSSDKDRATQLELKIVHSGFEVFSVTRELKTQGAYAALGDFADDNLINMHTALLEPLEES